MHYSKSISSILVIPVSASTASRAPTVSKMSTTALPGLAFTVEPVTTGLPAFTASAPLAELASIATWTTLALPTPATQPQSATPASSTGPTPVAAPRATPALTATKTLTSAVKVYQTKSKSIMKWLHDSWLSLGSPCEHGGSCVNTPGSYRCDCPVGFRGRRCEVNVNECESSPCQNEGTCIDERGSFRCICMPGKSEKNLLFCKPWSRIQKGKPVRIF